MVVARGEGLDENSDSLGYDSILGKRKDFCMRADASPFSLRDVNFDLLSFIFSILNNITITHIAGTPFLFTSP
jgi:hypothetical protein